MATGTRGIKHFQTPERLKALGDGVFAIALTLLIIDVVAVAKEVEEGVSLQQHLTDHWATGAAYLVGFLTIFVCWMNHQTVFEHVAKVDSPLVWVSGLQLALVSAVPLPTALLADHFTGDDSDTVFFLYGVTFFLMAFSFWILSRTVRSRSLLADDGDRAALGKLVHTYFIAVIWTVASLAVLQVSLYAAGVMWALMFLVFAFPVEFAYQAHLRMTSKIARVD